MKRTIIKIDEDLCNGCGLCIEGCHEGALQLIDGKARMISDLYCDGLGACIPECPVNAISLEEREAQPYDEIKVMERISQKGEATILAHLDHLIEHGQTEYARQGIAYVKENKLAANLSKLKKSPGQLSDDPGPSGTSPLRDAGVSDLSTNGTDTGLSAGKQPVKQGHAGGCPGARMMHFPIQTEQTAKGRKTPSEAVHPTQPKASSELRQWPVQLHLVHPQAPYFRNADVLLAADCVAFSMATFHQDHLQGKGLAIACPKLDHGKEAYTEKLVSMINDAHINTLTVMVMEVPCCNGLLQTAQQAAEKAARKVPVKAITVSLQGSVISEEWIV